MLESIDGASEKGLNAKLFSPEQLGWKNGGWQNDVVAIDSALQLALLWTSTQLNRSSLPMKISKIEFTSPYTPISRCCLLGREAKGGKARADAFLLDGNGEVAMTIQGMETIVIPSA
jgi:hypothetical protein